MYAEVGLLYPYFQSFSQEVHHLEDFSSRSQRPPNARTNLLPTSTISEYDFGEEGDLFKAPESIIEEPQLGLDPIISTGEDVIRAQTTDLQSRDQLLSDVFYECRKDLLAKSSVEEQLSELSDVKIPDAQLESLSAQKDSLVLDVPLPKSVSSGCLASVEWITRGQMKPNFLDFQGMDLGAAFSMRRAFSEGDIQNLGSGNATVVHTPFERTSTIGNYTIEERKQKLSRYRKKKSKRNFDRRIKYACRKALADSQPRVRGRFAKTEEGDSSNSSKCKYQQVSNYY